MRKKFQIGLVGTKSLESPTEDGSVFTGGKSNFKSGPPVVELKHYRTHGTPPPFLLFFGLSSVRSDFPPSVFYSPTDDPPSYRLCLGTGES